VDVLIGSIRYATRQCWSSRAFAASVVIALALGIGGTTAIVTLIDAVMLRPLPVSEPARLYRVGDGDDTVALGRHGRWGFFSLALYERLKAATPEFEDITAFGLSGPLSTRRQGTTDAARPLRTEYVSGSYFVTLGVAAFSGRLLAPDDDRPSATPVVVLSHQAWRGTYAADPSVVGSTFVVEGHPFTVVGVAAPGFFGETVRADPPEMWISLHQEPLIAGAGSLLHQSISPWLAAIGRLKPAASIAGINPRLTEILRQWIQHDAGYPSGWMSGIVRDLPMQTIDVVSARAGIGFGGMAAKEQYGPSLQMLFGICGLVAMIACANVANLLLARAVRRRTQTAVRLAIGASRRQIVAEALVESVLLALAGGLAGLPVANATARLLLALAFRNSQFVPIATTPSLAVLAFASALSLATGILFGAAPAWFAARTDPMDALRGSGRSTGRHAPRARAALLIVQATLSVVAVTGSTMLARSLANLEHQDFGYRVQGRVLIGLTRLPGSDTLPQLSSLYRDVEQRLATLPGVGGVGLALYNPLAAVWRETVFVAGHQPNRVEESVAAWDRVSAGYLETLGIAPMRGRAFTAADNETTAPVAIVNESFVRRFFKPNEDPINQRFGVDRPENAATFRIVGIVRDAKFVRSALRQPVPPMFYLPLDQGVEDSSEYRQMVGRLSHAVQGIVVVTDSPVGQLEPLLRRTLAAADPGLTITGVRTMQQQIDLAFDRERAVTSLAELFGIVALALAALGVYGVTSFTVAQQTSEIGIRMALGADRVTVIGLVVRRAFQRAAAGLVVGLAGAIGAGKLLAAQLYGVAFWDPFALTLAAVSLAACVFFAAIIPAGRAAAISPMRSLRSE
jgi:predicted permease